MLSTKVSKLLLVLVALLTSVCSHANDKGPEEIYEVYQGDIDGDGVEELYFYAIENFIPIGSDILVMIPLKDGEDFILYADGTVSQSTIGVDLQSLVLLSSEQIQLLSGDFDGNGFDDILVQSKGGSFQNAIVYNDGTQYQQQSFLFDNLDNYEVSSATLKVVDVNQDGKDDIQIAENGFDLSFIANSMGQFETKIDSETSSQLVGQIASSFRISSSGKAHYSVPVKIPGAGIKVAPSLSINYSSTQSNGLLGLGGKISGLSQIYRCPANFYSDGFIDPVDFDDNDNLCLDGERLIRQGTTNIFYTEKESFRKIVQLSQGFKVFSKNGLISFYGDDVNSQQVVAQGIVGWSLSRVEDRAGNNFEVTYKNSIVNQAIDFKPELIEVHSINSTGVKVIVSSINFDYESRTDATNSYRNGILRTMPERLSGIRIYSYSPLSGTNAIPVHQYAVDYIDYAASDNATSSKIKDISLCDFEENCVPKISFQWQNGGKYSSADKDFIPAEDDSGLLLGIDWEADTWSAEYSDANGWAEDDNKNTLRYPDLNGDGLSDICGRSDSGLVCAINNGTSFDDAQNWSTYFSNTNGFGDETKYGWYRYADLNSDGLDDVCSRGPNGVYCALNVNGSTFGTVYTWTNSFRDSAGWSGSASHSTMSLADVDGDGHIDVCGRKANGVYCSLSKGDNTGFEDSIRWTASFGSGWDTPDHYSTIRFVDVSSDGLVDVCGRGDSGIWCSVNSGSGPSFSEAELLSEEFTDADGWDEPDHYSTISFVDVNNDRLADICGRSDDGIECAINNGVDFSLKVLGVSYFSNSGNWDDEVRYETIRYVDVTRDGYVDVCGRALNSLRCAENDGLGGFKSISQWGTQFDDSQGYSQLEYIDLDGDGFKDVCGRNQDGLNCSLNKMPDYRLVERFINVDREYAIVYKPLSDQNVYSRDGDLDTFPVGQIPSTSMVASEVSETNGIGTSNVKNYRYSGLRFHYEAKKSLGFETKEVNDLSTGNVVTNSYDQRYAGRTVGMFRGSTVTASNGQVIHMSDHFVTHKECGEEGAKRFIPYTHWTFALKQDPDGNYLGNNSTYTQLTNDCYGNIEYRTVEDGSGAATRTTYTYHPADEENWFVEQVATEVVTSGEMETQIGYPEYDALLGKVTQSVVEPNGNSLTTFYEYDVAGNIELQTVSGSDIDTAITQYEYDDFNLYVDKIINAENFDNFEVLERDYRFGLPTSINDANDVNTLKVYDQLGRLVSESYSDGTESSNHYYWCSEGPDTCESNESYYMVKLRRGAAEHTTYYDRQGRISRNKSTAFDGGEIFTKVVYNELGDVIREFEPYRAGNLQHYSEIQYDQYQRPFKFINPDDSYKEVLSFNGLETTERDERGNETTITRNTLGKITQTIDANSYVTDYYYNDFEQLERTEVNAALNLYYREHTVAKYNTRGQRISVTTRSNGGPGTSPEYVYTYNSKSELVTQTDPNGNVLCYEYDRIGRPIKMVDGYRGDVTDAGLSRCGFSDQSHKISTWSYDTGANGLGMLNGVTGPGGYQETLEYDVFGRLEVHRYRIDGADYDYGFGYNPNTGRQDLTVYPNGFATLTNYDSNGYLRYIANGDNPDQIYVRANELTDRGQVAKFEHGNGLVTTYSYDEQTGRLNNLAVKDGDLISSPTLYAMEYDWDPKGNLDYRTDLVRQFKEDFDYDSVNRLSTTTIEDLSNVLPDISSTMQYDNNGNISYKPGVGTYHYGNASYDCLDEFPTATIQTGHHAVTSISGIKDTSFCYDNNGNMLKGDERVVTYNSFNQPLTAERGPDSVRYTYAPNKSMVKREKLDDSIVVERSTYASSAYSKIEDFVNNETVHRYKVAGSVVVEQIEGQSAYSELYQHLDFQGSLMMISDSSGEAIEHLSYDAWGLNRDADNWNTAATSSDHLLQNGYTGHKQESTIGLIHMKGRIYDPTIGRFLSEDPVVQRPGNPQNYNRYSYVLNNPLRYTDPTGYEYLGEEDEHFGDPIDEDLYHEISGHEDAWDFIEFAEEIGMYEDGYWDMSPEYQPEIDVYFMNKYEPGDTLYDSAFERGSIGYVIGSSNLGASAGANPSNQIVKIVTAFVGGGGDQSMHQTVENIARLRGAYFTWDQHSQLAEWIEANQGNLIRLVGHSYGGDTAAEVVADGYDVHTLITVDPVSWFNRPDYSDIADNSEKWINYDSVDSSITRNNIIGMFGGDWDDAPKGYADQFIESELGHGGICLKYCN